MNIITISFGLSKKKELNYGIISVIDSITLHAKKNTVLKNRETLNRIYSSVWKNNKYHCDVYVSDDRFIRFIFKKEN